MKPKWQKLASLAQGICTLWFQFFGAVFASKGYHFKNIFMGYIRRIETLSIVVLKLSNLYALPTFFSIYKTNHYIMLNLICPIAEEFNTKL